MDKNQQVFLNAASEGADFHSLGNKFSVFKTSYKCPHCKRANLVAETYEQPTRRALKEVDVSCPACGEKISLRY